VEEKSTTSSLPEESLSELKTKLREKDNALKYNLSLFFFHNLS